MHRQLRYGLAACVMVLLAPAGFAAPSETTVEFNPAVAALFKNDYGANEAAVLRSAILAALAKEEDRVAMPDGLSVKVTVRGVKPTHPTMEQQLSNPSLSPAHTRFLGGADLVGEIRDSNQQVRAMVDYRNFAGVLAESSPSLDPWADARQAIDTFAAKLAASWQKLPKG